MPGLTERYVTATLRSIPEDQRADIEAELRASIEDAIEARIADGVSPEAAETEVLTDLGDPDRLAADYAGRPSYLIGPEHFFDYKRLVTVLLVTVVPIVVVVLALIQVISGGDVGDVMAEVFSIGLSLVVHIVFWTTLVFYFIERSGEKPPTSEWTLASLPVAPTRGSIKLGDTIASIVFLVLAIAAMILSRTVSPITGANGEPIPVFDPGAWEFWLPFLVGVLVVEVLFELVKYHVGRWTWTLASFNVALNAAFAIPAVYLLATDRLLNSEFFAELGWGIPSAGSTSVTVAMVVIVAVALWDTIDGFRKARP